MEVEKLTGRQLFVLFELKNELTDQDIENIYLGDNYLFYVEYVLQLITNWYRGHEYIIPNEIVLNFMTKRIMEYIKIYCI